MDLIALKSKEKDDLYDELEKTAEKLIPAEQYSSQMLIHRETICEIYKCLIEKRNSIPIFSEIVECVKKNVYTKIRPYIMALYEKTELYEQVRFLINEDFQEELEIDDAYSLTDEQIQEIIRGISEIREIAYEAEDYYVEENSDEYVGEVSDRYILSILKEEGCAVIITTSSIQNQEYRTMIEYEMYYGRRILVENDCQSIMFPELRISPFVSSSRKNSYMLGGI